MTAQQLCAQVSLRLLAEPPRFFGAFEKALGELFQNAHRAERYCAGDALREPGGTPTARRKEGSPAQE